MGRLSATILAGLVIFKAGGLAEVPVVDEGPQIRLELPWGAVRFPRSAFRLVAAGPGPEGEWPARLAAARQGTAQDRFEAAWWALGHGLIDQAQDLLRDGGGPAPMTRMAVVVERLARPAPMPDLRPFQTPRPDAWKVAAGRQVVLLHQQDDAEAAERAALLDQVLRAYYLVFAAQGFDLAAPTEKLVSIWYASRDDYQAALRAEAAGAFLHTQGYYHPTKRVVYTYDLRTDPLFRAAAGDARARLLAELARRELELGAATHELIHQLVAVSGLAPRPESFPPWLHEGLAMQFEVVRGGRWAGVGRISPLRLAAWRASPGPSLRGLLRSERLAHPSQYAAAWCLVSYLRKRHAEQFHAWLDRLREPDATREDPRGVAAFERTFGPDLAPLERDWHRYGRGLTLPGELDPAGGANTWPSSSSGSVSGAGASRASSGLGGPGSSSLSGGIRTPANSVP